MAHSAPRRCWKGTTFRLHAKQIDWKQVLKHDNPSEPLSKGRVMPQCYTRPPQDSQIQTETLEELHLHSTERNICTLAADAVNKHLLIKYGTPFLMTESIGPTQTLSYRADWISLAQTRWESRKFFQKQKFATNRRAS